MRTKRFTIFGLFLLIGITVYSQVSVIPQGFNYQAVARNLDGSPRANQQINLRFTITNLHGTSIPYIETQSKTSDQFGLFTAIIGQGTQTGGTGSFSQIDWKAFYYYVKIEIQDEMTYYVMGTEPLLSVPYAMYAQRANYADHADTSNTNEIQELSLAGNNLTISNGNSIDISTIIPAGSIMPFAGTIAPDGWLFCDGTLYTVVQYPNLYAAIEIAYGGVLGTNFNVPDLRGRFLRGVDGTAGNDPDNSTRTASNTGGNTGNNVGSIQGFATALPVLNFTTDNQGIHQHSSSGISVSLLSDGDHLHGPGTLAGYASGNGIHSHTYTYWRTGSGGDYNGAGSLATTGATSSNGYHGHAVTIDSGSTANAGSHTHTANVSGNSDNAGDHLHSITSGGDNETRPKNVNVNYFIKY